jgi:hypothetical protein
VGTVRRARAAPTLHMQNADFVYVSWRPGSGERREPALTVGQRAWPDRTLGPRGRGRSGPRSRANQGAGARKWSVVAARCSPLGEERVRTVC